MRFGRGGEGGRCCGRGRGDRAGRRSGPPCAGINARTARARPCHGEHPGPGGRGNHRRRRGTRGAAGINRKTAIAYDTLLTNLLVLELTPAWATNRLNRLIKTPKRYLVDPALAGAALRLDATAVLRVVDLLGRLIDTFTVAQPSSNSPHTHPASTTSATKRAGTRSTSSPKSPPETSSRSRSKPPPPHPARTHATSNGYKPKSAIGS